MCSPAATSLEVSTPHQPTFSFPKYQFGKFNPVVCSFQVGWFHSWTWLHYHEATDSPLNLFLCVRAIREKKISSGNANTAFISKFDFDYNYIYSMYSTKFCLVLLHTTIAVWTMYFK